MLKEKIVFEKELKPMEMATYLLLGNLGNWNVVHGLTMGELASMISSSERSILRSIKKLEDLQYIEKIYCRSENGTQRPNTYRILK